MQKQIILKTSPHPSFGTGAVVTDRAGTTLGIAEAGFLAALQRIIAAARRLPDNLVLLGLTRTVRKGGNDPFTQRCKESSLDSMRRRAISRAAEQPSSRAAELSLHRSPSPVEAIKIRRLQRSFPSASELHQGSYLALARLRPLAS